MTLTSLFESFTRRETTVPAADPGQAQAGEIAQLVEAGEVQFVPASTSDADLGAAHDVRGRIADVLPGVSFDESGQGAFTRTGYALEFDTGADDRVASVHVHVVGGAAAVPPLQRLVAKTGWHLAAIDPTESEWDAPAD
jgi:hypothetical protein